MKKEKYTYNSYDEILNILFENKDEEYKKFNKKLIPGVENIIGVRIPIIKKIAKDIASSEYKEYIKDAKFNYYEENMLLGLVIANLQEDFEEVLEYIDMFLDRINNWAVCDSFCSGLKITVKYKKEMYKYISTQINSDNPWRIRFSLVMILDYYIEKEYLEDIFKKTDSIESKEYYVQMATAWLISICFVKYPKETLAYLENNKLDKFTYNKSLQKIVESNRVDKDTKLNIKNMKRR